MSREAFEAWISGYGSWPGATQRLGEGYKLPGAQKSWIAWQAAWSARDAEVAALVKERDALASQLADITTDYHRRHKDACDRAELLWAAAKERDALRAALVDAIECVEDWACYATDYMRKKHDIDGDLERLRAALGEQR